jgi:dienelactone hydrolase
MRLVLTFALFFASMLCHAASRFELPLPPGPMLVGFRVVQQYDHSRTFLGEVDPVTGKVNTGERARPVQTLAWYPATRSGQAMRYGDYLALIGAELDFTRSKETARAAADIFIRSEYFSESGPEQGQRELDGPVRARRDAAAVAGRFPVVIYAPSISAPAAENPDLCEYLASHGYIVIASPSVGLRTRDMPNDLEGAETHAADISYLIGYARTLPHADAGRVGVVGYSWGGIANVLAAAKDSRIKALVNLDGSVRYYPELMAAAKYVVPERFSTPMLFVAARPLDLEALAGRGKPAASFLNDMKYADLYKLTMHPMEHFAFSSTYLRFASDPRFNQYARSEVNRAHGWTVDYVKRFLDAYLKDDGSARAYLKAEPAAHGIPAHAATMDVRLAAAPSPSRERFAAELARQGFRNAHAVYRQMYGQDKEARLPEAELNAWGYALLQRNENSAALEIFRLATELYPTSANAFDSLAEGFARSGDKDSAIQNYQRVLALDPGSENARQQLAALGAPAT